MDIKDNRVLLIILVAIGAAAYFFQPKKEADKPFYQPKQPKPDTVYIVEQPTIRELKQVVNKYYPKTVTIYNTDTVLRDSVIKDTLNLGSTIQTGRVVQNQLTPKGGLIVTEYTVPDRHTEITIDREGFLQVKVDSAAIIKEERNETRNKRLRVIGAVAIFVAGIIIGK
jgi:hypothetical protein